MTQLYIYICICICVCIYIYIYIFYSGLSQDIEYSSLCYTKDLIVCLLYNYVKFKNNNKKKKQKKHYLLFDGEWIHVYEWLSPFIVHLKLSQHC